MTTRRAFTLIELLLAMFITSIVILATHAAFRQANMIFSRTENPRPIYQHARLITETLRRELTSLYIPPSLDPNQPNQTYPGIDSAGFTFHTLNPSWKTASPNARIAQITYKFTQHPQTGRGLLTRSEQLFAAEVPLAPPTTNIISEDLSAFTVTLTSDSNSPPKTATITLKWQTKTIQTAMPIQVQVPIHERQSGQQHP